MPDLWTPFLSFEGIAGNKDKQGIETVEAAYYVPTLAMARIWVPPDLVATIGLPLTRHRFQQEWGNALLIDLGKDGAYKKTFTLEGVANPSAVETGLEFNGDGKVSSDPAASHPDIQFLKDKYGGAVEDGKLVFPETISSGGASSGLPLAGSGYGFATSIAGNSFNTRLGQAQEMPNPLFDFKKYYAASLTWQCTYVTTAPSPNVTGRLGKIDTPRRAPDGYLPQIPDKHVWLKTIGTTVWKGNTWKVTDGWTAGNWVRDVYR